ncbi:hypothetical protein J4N02_03050 [Propioniciclava sp. MC1595]|uniref:hypothetical protein n=1 Tax=Propioniciclava sp. MC1595 TaxID=2760308 RepID=UPI0016625D81|nr:hypothetical protein [Propioniciclava sp. MC1595]MBB1495445.1 hypothetical protein [Propioniciclava sp. MC1595]QTE26608.1 hypothetical protein J4N02_03050 [Propioniciclava sp. MC1595]
MGRPRAKVKRGFGEVGQLPSGRYRARYTGPDGGRHSAPITFVARIDAEGWLVDQERMISRGEWEPPARQVREVHEAPLLLGSTPPPWWPAGGFDPARRRCMRSCSG